MSLHEHDFNQGLAAAMTACYGGNRINFSGESLGRLKGIRGSQRGDVIVSGEGLKTIVIEGEFSGHPDKDALAKIGVVDTNFDQKIQTTVAVCYPAQARSWEASQITKKLLNKAQLKYATFDQQESGEVIRFPSEGYLEGDVWSLTEMAVLLTNPYDQVIEIAKRTSDRLKVAIQNFKDTLVFDPKIEEDLAVIIGRPGGLDSFSILSMIWLNAFLFQDRIANSQKDVAHRSKLIEDKFVEPRRVKEAWQSVLDINYQSIYKPASDALNLFMKCSDTRALSHVLTTIINLADKIDIGSLGLFDIGGELFQEVISDRDNAASYYTKPTVAEFLARIVAHKLPTIDWGNYHNFRVGDFACGTGALLRSIYRQLLPNARQEGFSDDEIGDFHQYMMEQGFCGIDISPIAAHLTASSLANIQPQIQYQSTNIGVVSVGGSEGKTGSLEFLSNSEQPDLLGGVHPQAALISEAIGPDNTSLVVPSAAFDIVIMNPPYQRARGGQKQFDVAGVTEEGRQLAIEKCQQISSKLPAVNLQAGLANVFCQLATQSLKPGGRLGIILPMTAAQAPSWAKMRHYLEQNFDDLTVFSFAQGSRGGKYSLSADTHIGEIMVTGSKRSNPKAKQEESKLRFVVVDNFVDIKEAIEIARATNAALYTKNNGLQPEGHVRLGKVYCGYWLTVLANTTQPWSYVGITNFDLITLARQLAINNQLTKLDSLEETYSLPMTTIDQLFKVGPTHDLIGFPAGGDKRGQFEMHPINGRFRKVVSLWSNEADQQTSITVQPTHHGLPLDPSSKGIPKIMASASTLFYKRGVRYTSQKILAAKTQKSVLGGRAWTALKNTNPDFDSEIIESTFALFSNCSLGLLLHWAYTQRQQAGRSMVQVEGIKALPCPNFYDEKIYQRAKKLIPANSNLLSEKLDRLKFADKDPVRRKIDNLMAKILGIPTNSDGHCQILADIAQTWCKEPSVKGK